MNASTAVVAAFLILLSTAAAETPPPSEGLLDHLAGGWVLSGTIAGQSTTHDVSAEWVLNRGYIRIHEVSRETEASGAPAYEAIVFIALDAVSREYTCLWLDSTGNGGLAATAIGRATASGSSIPFVFCEPDGRVSFENTFAYDPTTDSWTWVMANIQDGQPRPFGRVTLVRQ